MEQTKELYKAIVAGDFAMANKTLGIILDQRSSERIKAVTQQEDK